MPPQDNLEDLELDNDFIEDIISAIQASDLTKLEEFQAFLKMVWEFISEKGIDVDYQQPVSTSEKETTLDLSENPYFNLGELNSILNIITLAIERIKRNNDNPQTQAN